MIDDDNTYLCSHHCADECENVSVFFMYVKLNGFAVGCDAVNFDGYQSFVGTCCVRRHD